MYQAFGPRCSDSLVLVSQSHITSVQFNISATREKILVDLTQQSSWDKHSIGNGDGTVMILVGSKIRGGYFTLTRNSAGKSSNRKGRSETAGKTCSTVDTVASCMTSVAEATWEPGSGCMVSGSMADMP